MKNNKEAVDNKNNNISHDEVTAIFNEIIDNMDSYDESFLLALVNRVNKYHEEHNIPKQEKSKVKKKN